MSKQPTELQLLQEIAKKLDLLTAHVAALGADESDRLDRLLEMGFESPVIASALGCTAGYVRSYKSTKKSRKNSKK